MRGEHHSGCCALQEEPWFAIVEQNRFGVQSSQLKLPRGPSALQGGGECTAHRAAHCGTVGEGHAGFDEHTVASACPCLGRQVGADPAWPEKL